MFHNKKYVISKKGCDDVPFHSPKTMKEQVLLVGCQTDEVSDEQFFYSMEELASLVITAKGEVVGTVTQKRKKIEPATYIGRGKIGEVAAALEETEADVIIFNDELTASQVRNLAKYFGEDVRIIDRTQLILDIFAMRAQSREGKLQVELAQLEYLLPRLHGQGEQLSRLGGGIGTRGPGETKLETDRRHIHRRMNEIKKQLEAVVSHRERYRERRKESHILQVALVGYTNAGKSTLLNRLTEANTLEEDLLFATLDPTTRKMKLPSGFTVLLTDTVGFIQNLPTTLIAAFRSTLEEVLEADLILHIIDASHPNIDEHEKTVLALLEELGATAIPILNVYNKMDLVKDKGRLFGAKNSVFICAHLKEDIGRLKQEIEKYCLELMDYYRVFIPPSEGKLLADIQSYTIVRKKEWHEDKEAYEIQGFVHPHHPLVKKLANLT